MQKSQGHKYIKNSILLLINGSVKDCTGCCTGLTAKILKKKKRKKTGATSNILLQ